MGNLAARYAIVKDAAFRRAAFASLAALIGSIWLSIVAGQFSTTHASNSVGDLILSNTPVLDLDILFVAATLLFGLFVALVALREPRRLPYMFFSLAIFFTIRSGFVTLTHIAPFPAPASDDFGTTIQQYFFGADLFFSGHTGSPYLLALIFWEEKLLRYVFLAWSVFFAAVVLLGHLHYSIDVASAYFITYSIHALCAHTLPRYRALFRGAPVPAV